jgi:putative peptidoglycan lipid II flippase
MLEVVARSFYADKDTLTPLWAAIGGATINLVMALLLSGILFGEPDIRNVSGLALANSLGVMFEVGVLLVILRRRWQGINENTLTATTVKTIFASLIMGAAVLGVEIGFNLFGLTDRFLFTATQVGTQIIVGGVVFLIATLLLGMDEVRDLLNMILRRRKVEMESVQPIS